MNNISWYCYLKKSTGYRLIYGTQIRMVMAENCFKANKYFENWNVNEHDPTQIWESHTGLDYGNTENVLKHNTFYKTFLEFINIVKKVANDSNNCTECPIYIEIISINGKKCHLCIQSSDTEKIPNINMIKAQKIQKEKDEDLKLEKRLPITLLPKYSKTIKSGKSGKTWNDPSSYVNSYEPTERKCYQKK